MRGALNARVTFRGAPVHTLERFAFRDVGAAAAGFRSGAGLDECVILQTCNRVEVFGSGGAGGVDLRRTWASLSGLGSEDAGRIEVASGGEVTEHLLRLAAGLDSMAVGEEQILGQMRESVSSARSSGSAGARLGALFDSAVRAGARIRAEAGLGRAGASVGAMAVRLAEENVDGLKSRRILLVGAGGAASTVAKALARRGYGFSVASRTRERSAAFCQTMGRGEPVAFEDVMADFGAYDVVFVAASAPYLLVTRESVAGAPGRRGGMMILDLSNPRTVDEGVAEISGVKLMNLDQVAEIADRSARSMRCRAREAEGMVSREAPKIEARLGRLDAEPVIRGVFLAAEEARSRELAKALRMMGGADGRSARILDDMTRAIVEGVVSGPVGRLREAAGEGDGGVLAAAERIFGGRRGGAPA